MRKAPPRIDPGTRSGGAIYPRAPPAACVVNKIIFRMHAGHSLVHARLRLSFYELRAVYRQIIAGVCAVAYSCFSAR